MKGLVYRIEASTEIYQAAIASAAKNLTQELDIDLDNYDITEEAYEALMEAAASKFGNCIEFEGSIFDVLVAEYEKLILFRSSKERDAIIKHNALSATELHPPPGNKILK